MTLADGDIVPPTETIPHYYGDGLRVIFVAMAVLILIAQSMGIISSFSTLGAIVAAVALVISAGITNPTQSWIHWVNALLALMGTLIFGVAALTHYRLATEMITSASFVNTFLAVLSLIALYLTTKTIRGFYLNVF